MTGGKLEQALGTNSEQLHEKSTTKEETMEEKLAFYRCSMAVFPAGLISEAEKDRLVEEYRQRLLAAEGQ